MEQYGWNLMVFFSSCNFLKIIFYSFFLFFIQGKENLKFSTKKTICDLLVS